MASKSLKERQYSALQSIVRHLRNETPKHVLLSWLNVSSDAIDALLDGRLEQDGAHFNLLRDRVVYFMGLRDWDDNERLNRLGKLLLTKEDRHEVSAESRAAPILGKVPQLPVQELSPAFVIADDGRIDLAPQTPLVGADAPSIAQQREIQPILLNLTDALLSELSAGNQPHFALIERLQAFRKSVGGQIDTMDFGISYLEGVRLRNTASAVSDKILQGELPTLSVSAQERLNTILDLHGAFVLLNPVAATLLVLEERYRRSPAQEKAFQQAATVVAQRLQQPDLVAPRAAEVIAGAANQIAVGPNSTRGTVVGVVTLKNVSILLIAAASLGTAPVIGAALGGAPGAVVGAASAFLGLEGLKKSEAFRLLTTILGQRYDDAGESARRLLATSAVGMAKFTEFVVRKEEELLALAAASPEFSWIRRSITWIKRVTKGLVKEPDNPETAVELDDLLAAFDWNLDTDRYALALAAFKRDLAGQARVQLDEVRTFLKKVLSIPNSISVPAVTVIAGTGGPQKAIVTLDVDGRHLTTEAAGRGPAEAIFNAIDALTGLLVRRLRYVVQPPEGDDQNTLTSVEVLILGHGREAVGKASDEDMLTATARAYASASLDIMDLAAISLVAPTPPKRPSRARRKKP